eukprot:Gregarina_sp_Poly_1__9459@NODE_593_length_7311_cov_152_329238_g458_i0_p2_GENE_NODE_593_length_7311_cov_152_329238_g458_i0NODE_593_length_7311_cov_152_329238_g458_i0_p2_ORF_typecomplete_len374_score32_71GHMP_kinases_N/PF00288_26/1_2e12GHMP_kinases_N/PF00288_26/6_2e03GHMP_kinases_C/PF08544_13/8_2e03GHMP_kinases_C/PF08544_13/1_8e06_NODE_593_length_7311_cov_152_329238_g458_i055326653
MSRTDDSLSTTSTSISKLSSSGSHEILYKSGDSVTVRAPATSANLGCGFDCFGLALDLWLTLTVTVSHEFSYEHVGFVDPDIPRDETNDVVLAFMIGIRHLKAMPTAGQEFAFHSESQIPVGRGLGSSAAAIVAGLAASFALCGRSLQNPETLDELAVLACRQEGHPDNVLPAIYGEMQIGAMRYSEDNQMVLTPEFVNNITGDFVRQAVPFPCDRISCLVFVPNARFSTREARSLLPECYNRQVVSQNLAKAAMFVAALLCGDYDNLKFAVEDSMHQPYRAPHCPTFETLKDLCHLTDALAVYLSGAGPSTVILTRAHELEQVDTDLRRLSSHLFNANEGTLMHVAVSRSGVELLNRSSSTLEAVQHLESCL